MSYLLVTCQRSEYVKKEPDPGVIAWSQWQREAAVSGVWSPPWQRWFAPSARSTTLRSAGVVAAVDAASARCRLTE